MNSDSFPRLQRAPLPWQLGVKSWAAPHNKKACSSYKGCHPWVGVFPLLFTVPHPRLCFLASKGVGVLGPGKAQATEQTLSSCGTQIPPKANPGENTGHEMGAGDNQNCVLQIQIRSSPRVQGALLTQSGQRSHTVTQAVSPRWVLGSLGVTGQRPCVPVLVWACPQDQLCFVN